MTLVWRIVKNAYALGFSFALARQSISGDSPAVHGTR
jgi:hypothetical protein